MKAGQTIAATIPAAVIAIALFRCHIFAEYSRTEHRAHSGFGW